MEKKIKLVIEEREEKYPKYWKEAIKYLFDEDWLKNNEIIYVPIASYSDSELSSVCKKHKCFKISPALPITATGFEISGLLHELGHIYASSKESLLLPNYGGDCSLRVDIEAAKFELSVISEIDPYWFIHHGYNYACDLIKNWNSLPNVSLYTIDIICFLRMVAELIEIKKRFRTSELSIRAKQKVICDNLDYVYERYNNGK